MIYLLYYRWLKIHIYIQCISLNVFEGYWCWLPCEVKATDVGYPLSGSLRNLTGFSHFLSPPPLSLSPFLPSSLPFPLSPSLTPALTSFCPHYLEHLLFAFCLADSLIMLICWLFRRRAVSKIEAKSQSPIFQPMRSKHWVFDQHSQC